MWKSSASIVGKTSGLDDLPLALQQEINDFLHYSQGRKQQKLVPRINKIDFTKAMVESEYILCMQVHVCNKDFIDGWPLSSMTSIASMSLTSITLERDRGKFCLAIRIPKSYPKQMPDISCVTGGEYVPVELKKGPSFVIPWIASGWPPSYTLMQFAQDLCTALGAPEKISTTNFIAEQKVFPLDQVLTTNQLYPPSPTISSPITPIESSATINAQHNGSVDLLMMGNEYQNGPAKKAGVNFGSKTKAPATTNPFDTNGGHSPHNSQPMYTDYTSNLNQSGMADPSGLRQGSPTPPVYDLLDIHVPPSHSKERQTPDIFSHGDNPTSVSWKQGNSGDRNEISHNLNVQITQNTLDMAGNISPRSNMQSPRGLEVKYRSNECCIKCKFKDEARRFVFDRGMNFQQLQESIKRLFQFPSSAVIVLVYLDSDGDKCGLSSDEELRAALTHFPDTLILHAEIKSTEAPPRADLLQPPPAQNNPVVASKSNDVSLREIKIEDVKLDKCIGVGSSCKVYKALWRGTEVAIKKFTSQNPDTVNKEFKHEVQMMTHLGCHPCIVLLLAVCSNPKCIVFEYLPFSLFEQINGTQDPTKKIPPFPNTWQKRLQMIMDVARGLQFLHSFNIVHRDLKSLNLLITDEGRVKLADFGIAKVAQDEFMTRCCGTYQWMAPEVIVSQTYSVSADIYSFGVVMWEICEASVPFADTPAALVAMAVIQENKRPTISPNIPMPLKDLITKCWDKDAALRPDAATIVNALTNFLQASQSPT